MIKLIKDSYYLYIQSNFPPLKFISMQRTALKVVIYNVKKEVDFKILIK